MKADIIKQDKASQADVIFYNEMETQKELVLGVDIAVNTRKFLSSWIVFFILRKMDPFVLEVRMRRLWKFELVMM